MRTIYLLDGVFLGGLGVVILAESLFDIRRLLAARNWPVVEGRIVQSRLLRHGRWHDDYTERLKLKYEFIVDGKTYTGHRIRAGQELDLTIGHNPTSAWSTSRSDAENYMPGAPVSVLYDPHNPRRCCLQTGGWSGIAVKLALGIGLSITGGLLIRSMFR